MKWVTNLLMLLLLLVPAVAADGISGLDVALLRYEPQPVQPGQVMDVYMQVSNTGDPTQGTSLELLADHPFTIEPSQDKERALNLGSISAPQTLHFRVRVAQDAKDGLATLRVRYKANQQDAGYVERSFDVNIQTFDARLDVIKVRQVPEEIPPGEVGQLMLTLQNNDDKPLQNIDVVLDLTNSYDANTNMDNMLAMQAMVNARLEDVNRRVASGQSPLRGATPMMDGMGSSKGLNVAFDTIAPVGGSNQKRIPLIESKQLHTIVFDIMPLPTTKPNVYAVPLYVNYNDEDNNPFHTRYDIPARVNMEPELYVALERSTLRTTDFAGELVFTVANRGLSELRYVTLELQGSEMLDIITAPHTIYLGDLGPGESAQGTFNVLAHERDITLSTKVSFRDAFNKAHEVNTEQPFKIINKNYYRDLPYEMALAWIILGLVVFGLTAYFVMHMKKK